MVELFSKTDYISKIKDNGICEYLSQSFSKYPDDFEFGAESSFIVLDDISELNMPIQLSNNNVIPSINDDIFQDMITMIDGNENVIDIILLFSDVGDGVSIILNKKYLSNELITIFSKY